MTIRTMLAAVALFGAAVPAQAQDLAGIVPEGGSLTLIAGGMTGADAPCWGDGVLLFSAADPDAPGRSITCRMSAGGTVSTLRTAVPVTTAIAPTGSGTYWCCEPEEGRVVEIDRYGTIVRTVAEGCGDEAFLGPNSLVPDGAGGMYLADARYSPDNMGTRNGFAVYQISADGSVVRVSGSVFFPHGLALSPDGSRLYVANAYGDNVLDLVYSFAVEPDGSLADMHRFATLSLSIMNESVEETYANLRCPCSDMTFGPTHYVATSGADACAVDAAGNLYVATNQGIGIQVFDPAGRYRGNINTGSPITGCAFGGPDMMTLYVTAGDGIYALRTAVPGARLALGN